MHKKRQEAQSDSGHASTEYIRSTSSSNVNKSLFFRPYRDWDWHEDDFEVQWTIENYECLRSIYSLHHRTHAHHNNIHIRHLYDAPGAPEESEEVNDDASMRGTTASFRDTESTFFRDMSSFAGVRPSTQSQLQRNMPVAIEGLTIRSSDAGEGFDVEDIVATVVRFRNIKGPHAWSKYPIRVSAQDFKKWVSLKDFNGHGNEHMPRKVGRGRTKPIYMEEKRQIKEVRALTESLCTDAMSEAIDGLWGHGSAAAAAETISAKKAAAIERAAAAKAAAGLQTFSKDLEQSDMLWIHAENLSVLQEIAKVYELQELFLSAFGDERAHNTLLVDGRTVFFSTCTAYLDGLECHLQKVYMYASFGDGLFITMEKEIMTGPRAVEAKSIYSLSESRVISELMDTKLGDADGNFYELCCTVGGTYLINQIQLLLLAMQDTILDFFSHVSRYFNFLSQIDQKIPNQDKLFIMQELFSARRSISMVVSMNQESADLYSKLYQYLTTGSYVVTSQFAIKDAELLGLDKSNKRDTFTRSAVVRISMGGVRPAPSKTGKKLRRKWTPARASTGAEWVNSGALDEVSLQKLFYPNIAESVNFFDYSGVRSKAQQALENEAEAVRPRPPLLTDHQTRYIFFLVDKIKFTTGIIEVCFDDCEQAAFALQLDTDLRAVNTDTIMAMISTLFLPSSFLIGISSTNMQTTTGDYYLGTNYYSTLVIIFSLIGIFFFLNLYYFSRTNLINWSINWKRFCSYLTGYHFWCSSRRTRDPNRARYQEAIIQRATGDYVRTRVPRTFSESSASSMDKSVDDRALIRKLTNITIAEDEELNRSSLYDSGSGNSSRLSASRLSVSNRSKSLKDLFVSEDGGDDPFRSRMSSTASTGSGQASSSSIVRESQAARILKLSGMRDPAAGTAWDLQLDHHMVHRFRQQQHSKGRPQPVISTEEKEAILQEKEYQDRVETRRKRIFQLAALPATVPFEESDISASRYSDAGSMMGQSMSSFRYQSQSFRDSTMRMSTTAYNPARKSIVYGTNYDASRAVHTSYSKHTQESPLHPKTGVQDNSGAHGADSSRLGSFTSSVLLNVFRKSEAVHSRPSVHHHHRQSHAIHHDDDSDDGDLPLTDDVDDRLEQQRLIEVRNRRALIAKGRSHGNSKQHLETTNPILTNASKISHTRT